MSKQDEAFENKWKHPTMNMPGTGDKVAAEWWFAAGREAERERMLGIVAELRESHMLILEPRRPMFNMPINVYINACDEITRRIKEQE